jgi:hypothetical protein
MSHPRRDRTVNPAEIRGDIDRGRTGDKRPGFDPAMAPLETDSEAGGAPMTAEHVRIARREQPVSGHREKTSYGDAMRDFRGAPEEAGKADPAAWLAILSALLLLAVRGRLSPDLIKRVFRPGPALLEADVSLGSHCSVEWGRLSSGLAVRSLGDSTNTATTTIAARSSTIIHMRCMAR